MKWTRKGLKETEKTEQDEQKQKTSDRKQWKRLLKLKKEGILKMMNHQQPTKNEDQDLTP